MLSTAHVSWNVALRLPPPNRMSSLSAASKVMPGNTRGPGAFEPTVTVWFDQNPVRLARETHIQVSPRTPLLPLPPYPPKSTRSPEPGSYARPAPSRGEGEAWPNAQVLLQR